jgi:pyridoxine 5'-phosphate synthase PdxJ
LLPSLARFHFQRALNADMQVIEECRLVAVTCRPTRLVMTPTRRHSVSRTHSSTASGSAMTSGTPVLVTCP